MKAVTNIDGRDGRLEFSRKGSECAFLYQREGEPACDGVASLVEVEPGVYSILVEGRSFEVRVSAGAGSFSVLIGGQRYTVELRDPRAFGAARQRGVGEGRQIVAAPMPGKVVRVLVNAGDEVAAGAGLVVVEAMKMQNEMKASKAGKVVELRAEAGATVAAGDVLVVIE